MSHLNLMPIARRRRTILRRRLKQWGLVSLLAVSGLCLLSWSETVENQRIEAMAAALSRQYEPIQVMQAEIDAIRKQIETLKTQQKLAGELAKQKSIISLMALLSDASIQRSDRICVRKLTLTTTRRETESGAQFQRNLSLQGIALNSGDISVFSSSLEDSNAFSTVHLESSETQQFGRIEAQSYALQCTY